MGAIDVDTLPVSAPPDEIWAAPETGPGEELSEPDETTSPRRWGWVVAVVAGLVVAVVVVVLMWLLLRNPSPQPPQSLRIETTRAESVGLEWDAPDGGPSPESYVILRGAEEVGSVDAPATSFVVAALTPNTGYEFAVVSVDGDRRSEPSETIVVTTDPGAPASFQFQDLAATSVRLRWDAPTGPSVESYVILNGAEEVGSVNAPAASFVVAALTPNTGYEFAVVSVDGDRRSEPSEAIVVTTDPDRPFLLESVDLTATSVRLQWEPPTGPSVESYVIVNEGDELAVVPHPETSFVFDDLIPGAPYEFAVVSQDGARRSTPAWISVTAIAPSPGEPASDPAGTTTDTIVVTWSPPADVGPPSEYIVIRDGEMVANVPGGTLSYTDTGLSPGFAYEYRVAANWGFENSEPTDSIVVATVEPPIADARLAGTWPVEVTNVKDPGQNLELGTTWISTWDIESACDAGACDVTLVGAHSPPGFDYKSFVIDLTRDGASYTGSATAQITYCDSLPVDNTVTAVLTVDAAEMDDGMWTASSWSGTLEIASPYTEVGQYYCSSQTIRQDLTAAR